MIHGPMAAPTECEQYGRAICDDTVLHRRRRTGRNDAGLSAGTRRHRCRRAGEARRFPAGFPRRHDPPVHPRADARTGPARRIPAAAPPQGQSSRRPDRRHHDHARRFHRAADHLQVHRLHAAMGFPQFPRRPWPALSRLPSDDEHAGHRPRVRGRAGDRRAGERATAPRSRSAPISWWPPTAAIRRCASGPASWWRISARRWTYCGCAYRESPPTLPKRSAISRPAAFSSCSTAATTGNAPTSSPRVPPAR